ncbi:MAG: DUF87 domain-containing protein, partial [Gammaproteobacteria bacterium]|nr:DUF87 domain-containing protein [Gammaproteobacteria bacterium]
ALPLDAVTQTFAIMAKRGVGKTHTASVLAEEMLTQGQPIVVYDPTSAWWGLKSSADGKRPGFPVVIFGGEHADVPLEETAGEMIATVIVERRLPAILDCGLMRKGARIRFMTAFCETLYHRNREPLHFFIDEAQTVAPQNLKAMPEIARLVGALEDIVLQGRRRGLGVTVISPRPAIVNTSIRSACEVLIAMQIVGPRDRKAIQEWIDVHGDDTEAAKQMITSLSSLKRGEAWIWSPAWLELFVRTKFRARATFDSSATPEVGSRVVAPSKMADIDLAKLGAEIAATVERVKADDPKELRKQIAELQRQLKARPVTAPAKAESIEVPVLKEIDRKWLHHAFNEVRLKLAETRDSNRRVMSVYESMEKDFQNFERGLGRIAQSISGITTEGKRPTALVPGMEQPRPPSGSGVTPQPSSTTSEGGGNGSAANTDITRPQQRILNALASFEAMGVQRVRRVLTAFYSNASPRSSSYTNNLGTLRSRGLIVYLDGDHSSLTDIGRQFAALSDDVTTNSAIHETWFAKLSRPQADILKKVIEIYPADIDKDQLARGVNASVTSSSYTNNLGTLRSLGAIDYPAKGRVCATALLFPMRQ